MKNITIIGYGPQGKAVAFKLNQAGHSITVYDLDPQCLEAAAKNGLTISPVLEEAVKNAAYILVVVTAGNAAKDLLISPKFLACLSPQQKIIQMGSYAPEDALEIAKQLALKNVAYIECILSGPSAAVLGGNCPLLCGGSKEDFDEVQKLFHPIGKVIHLGDVGKAAIFNLAGLTVLYALANGFALSTAMIERSDIDLTTWFDFFKSGLGSSAENLLKLFTDFLWPAHFKDRNYQLMGSMQCSSEGAANETQAIVEFTQFLQLDTRLVNAMSHASLEAKKIGKKQDWSSMYDVLVPPK